MKILKKDEIIELTAEEYEDYHTVAVIKVLKNFDYTEILDEYLKKFCIIATEAGQFDYYLFIAYLCNKGLITLHENAHLPSLHIGSYGCPTLY